MDKKTVIEKLECFRLNADPQHCTEEKCPYNNADPEFGRWCLSNRLIYDAIELLKEQEPVKPIDETYWDYTYGRCGHCRAPLPALEGLRSKFCWMCGKAVKWDG